MKPWRWCWGQRTDVIELLPEVIRPYCVKAEAVGSRVTCDPPPNDTDQDVLLLVDAGRFDEIRQALEADGFDHDGSEVDDQFEIDAATSFQSFSLGDLNFIITASAEFYGKFMAASSVAKRLNLMRKDDRVALFQAVLYGNRCDGV